jgi:hypothetical protein
VSGAVFNLPADLEMAAIELVRCHHAQMGRDPNIKKESLKSWSAEYVLDIPQCVKTVIDAYRVAC